MQFEQIFRSYATNPKFAQHARLDKEMDLSILRYGQCWEDADILHEALNCIPGQVHLSIASAGDNALSLLATRPKRVIAIDLSPAQLASLELRVAAYKSLEHHELLELIGSRQSTRRFELYGACRKELSLSARGFWDDRKLDITEGIGGSGRFERYIAVFRRYLLPLCQTPARVDQLFRCSKEDKGRWYAGWDNARWRLLFRAFSSRFVLGRYGRDPRLFQYVDRLSGAELRERFEHISTALDAKCNPYLHWLAYGHHGAFLPRALRAENFEVIRDNLDRLEWHCTSLEGYVDKLDPAAIDTFNLSNVFEYMPRERYHALLTKLARSGRRNARLAYWNLFAWRRRPAEMGGILRSLNSLAHELHMRDKVFFYSDFVVEEVV